MMSPTGTCLQASKPRAIVQYRCCGQSVPLSARFPALCTLCNALHLRDGQLLHKVDETLQAQNDEVRNKPLLYSRWVSQLHWSFVEELFETLSVRAVTFDDLVGGQPIGFAQLLDGNCLVTDFGSDAVVFEIVSKFV